jgi:hypothetical protein
MKSNSKIAISFTELTENDPPIKPGTEFATANKSGSVTVFRIKGKPPPFTGSRA